jgi:N-acetylated-alpha-linked acidic dipeptidase
MLGSQSLERLVNQVAREVRDPATRATVAERRRARLVTTSKGDELKEARDRRDFRVEPLGAGSDYTPYLQHLGITSLNLGYGGEDGGGVYHSVYDSFDHYTRFGDPTFAYGVALAQTAGRTVLRLAQADVVPMDFTAVAGAVKRFAREVQELADESRAEAEESNRRVREGAFGLAADPSQRVVLPTPQPPVPHVNLGPLLDAAARVEESAREYDRALSARVAAGPLPLETQRALDAQLMAAERALTREQGLPGRPWFRHQVYAPGRYTGYGVKTLPAVREALELRQWEVAEEQARTVAATLTAYASHLDRARALLGAP